VLTRQNLVADLTREPASHYQLHFYELQGNAAQGRGYLEPRSIVSEISELAFVSIQVIAEPGPETGISYTIYCDEREFSELEFGGELFREVAGYILSQRRGGERYPCYITDLDLAQCRDLLAPQGGLQLSHYLRIKAEVEWQLNYALTDL
jgi:adenylate cyclase class 1